MSPQRISSEPLIAWGDTGGPGKPLFKSNPSHSKLMAPPFGQSRRHSMSIATPSDFSSTPLTNPDMTVSLRIPSQTASDRPPGVTTTSGNLSMNGDEDKLTKAMRCLYNVQDKHFVDGVFRDVIQKDLGVSFDDIAALDVAKRLLNEAVILPLIMPEFFTGIREPWRVRKPQNLSFIDIWLFSKCYAHEYLSRGGAFYLLLAQITNHMTFYKFFLFS